MFKICVCVEVGYVDGGAGGTVAALLPRQLNQLPPPLRLHALGAETRVNWLKTSTTTGA